MNAISEEALLEHRSRKFRLREDLRLKHLDDAINFVEERGFVFLWPIKGVDLPSLWTAVAGARPVANEHDDPGHITWGWKDEMLDKRRWYYAKLLRGKATIVSLKTLPYFYALTDRVAEMDDFLLAYEAGHLTHEAKRVAEVLLEHGPQNTVNLRRLARLSSQDSKARFDRALVTLQKGMWVVPIGVAEAGAWRYSFVYELFDRWHSLVPDQARGIKETEAREYLINLYLVSVGAAPHDSHRKLFGWSRKDILRALDGLRQAGAVIELEDGRWANAYIG